MQVLLGCSSVPELFVLGFAAACWSASARLDLGDPWQDLIGVDAHGERIGFAAAG
jgi:hypothetical protein